MLWREGGIHCCSPISAGCIIVHAIVIVVGVIGGGGGVFVRIRTTFMYKFPIRQRTSYGEAGCGPAAPPLLPLPFLLLFPRRP